MRIRKNAKISQISISSTITSPSSISSLTKTHLKCQLNQSPWDIITFPPSDSSSSHYFQVDEDFGFAGNGSSGDSIVAIRSAGSMKSFMESGKRLNYDKKWDFGHDDNGEERETQVGLNNGEEKIKDEEDIVLCSETNGKGWQCGRVVKKGYKTCARHLKNGAVLGGKKSSDTTAAHRGRGRPRIKKKEPAPSPVQAQNPYEFYYYSGFGPLWGKKKGPGRAIGNAIGMDYLDTSISKNIEETKRAKDEEIDYMECDDEEVSGKKRGRKRIKARSLKSLM